VKIPIRFVPLERWPIAPTKARARAPFRSTYTQTLKLLEYELFKLNAKSVYIQAFYGENQIRNDGWPYSNAQPSQPGIILSFRSKDTPLLFPCDRYVSIDDNLRAIALSLQALRAVDRYGVTRRSEQYAGWKQIEAPKPADGFSGPKDAAIFIVTQQDNAVPADYIIENAALRQEVYRRAARRLHPDAPTGNHDLFVRLQQALAILEAPAQ
jgi:hypothetical protein